MLGTVIAAVVMTGDSDVGWQLSCCDPFDLLQRELASRTALKFPMPGSPLALARTKRPWVSFSLMPDLVGYDTESADFGRSYGFNVANDSRSIKAQLLRRFGLKEVRSRGFGATLRFASAPNWAFQFRGRKRFTVAYITRF
jgi:hypothetical protein